MCTVAQQPTSSCRYPGKCHGCIQLLRVDLKPGVAKGVPKLENSNPKSRDWVNLECVGLEVSGIWNSECCAYMASDR